MDQIAQSPAAQTENRGSPQSEVELESIKSTQSKEESNVEDGVGEDGEETQKPPLQRYHSVVSSDGRTRSKWRLIAIVTALFVKPPF